MTLPLLILLLREDHLAVQELAARPGFDFAGFEAFVTYHQLRSYVRSALETSPARRYFPPPLIDRLDAFYQRQRIKQQVLFRALRELAGDLSDAGQDFILLKGPYLADRFYGGLAWRSFWDLDILVRSEELPQAQRLLAARGYVRTSPVLFSESVSRAFTHAFDYGRVEVSLDLHWALMNHPSYHLDYPALWAARQGWSLDGEEVCVLSDEYELSFAFLSALRDIERAALRLRSFVDLYMILRQLSRTLDWTLFLERRRRENVSNVCLRILRLFLDVLDCRERFPEAALALDRHDPAPRREDPATAGRLLAPSRFGVAHKRWAARVYETSPLRFFRWWLISLPFRLVVYRPGKLDRLRNRLREWTRESRRERS